MNQCCSGVIPGDWLVVLQIYAVTTTLFIEVHGGGGLDGQPVRGQKSV